MRIDASICPPEGPVRVERSVPLLAIGEEIGRGQNGISFIRRGLDAAIPLLETAALAVSIERTAEARQRLNEAIESVFYDIDRSIVQDARAAGVSGVGLVIAVVAGARVHVATVGSGVVCLVRGGSVERINRDRSGEALGTTLPVDIDLAEAPIASGDRIMVASREAMAAMSENPILADRDWNALVADSSNWPNAVGVARLAVDGDSPADAMTRALGASFLLRDLSMPERLAVAAYLDDRLLEPGAVLVREGEPGDEFFIIASGTLRITRSEVLIRDLGEGAHLGELALIGDGRRTATATAVDRVRVLAMSRERFEALRVRRPELGVRLSMTLLRTVADRLRDLTERYAANR